MDNTGILFASTRFVVTETTLRTPRKTYALKDVDYVQIKRPLFTLSVVLGGLLLAWAVMFWDLLYPGERGLLLAAPVLASLLASRIGTLVVHSWSLRGGELEEALIWDIATIRAIRDALDNAMLSRRDRGHAIAAGARDGITDGESGHGG